VRIGVLTNLRAGHNSAKIARMRSVLQRYPHVAAIETADAQQVPEALARLLRQDIGLLVVHGGDGTLQRVLTVLLGDPVSEPLPLIAPLRGGRTNMIARDIGSHRDPGTALSSLVVAAQQGAIQQKIVERPVLRIVLGPEGPVQYGMFFGLGVLHRAIALKHKILPPKHFQGMLGSAAFVGILVARAAFGSLRGLLTPDTLEITCDGQPLEATDFMLVMVTTLERLFLRMRPFWGQEQAPIRLTAIAANAPRSLWGALGIVSGCPPAAVLREKGYISRNIHQAVLRLQCGVTVDGELFAPQPDRIVQITAERRVRFVCSRPAGVVSLRGRLLR
jgi:hypothetical protein